MEIYTAPIMAGEEWQEVLICKAEKPVEFDNLTTHIQQTVLDDQTIITTYTTQPEIYRQFEPTDQYPHYYYWFLILDKQEETIQTNTRRVQTLTRQNAAMLAAGAQALTGRAEPPSADAGIFAEGLPPWTPGKTYGRGEVFRHEENAGYCKQEGVLAQAHQPPFSVGLEAVYGSRPAPDEEGIYPYLYNMAAAAGMRVRQEDGEVYRCTADIGEMLWPPSRLPAHFTKEE